MKSFPKDISVMDILCILCKQVFLQQKNVDIIIYYPKVFLNLKL